MKAIASQTEPGNEKNEGLRAAERRAKAQGLCALVALVAVGWTAVLLDGPPPPKSASAIPGQFSAERALKHVAAIGRQPHPVGSPAHQQVKAYIMSALAEAGLTLEEQRTTAVNWKYEVAGTVENVIARLKGRDQKEAILLMAHYDSVSTGAGASDDGAGVAALLETARVLKSIPQLQRDVIFLFTDAEECGLLGAQAFVAEHPLAREVGLVLNFEARGNSGSAVMFETNEANGWLVEQFGSAVSRPAANSLSYEIYKRLPNDTDFSVFKAAGYSGLNFAFIDGLVRYHTLLDSPENLNPGSLQHEGDYATQLLTFFGNSGEINRKREPVVYFDVMGRYLAHYSLRASRLLIGFAGVLLVTLMALGYRRGVIKIRGILAGLLILLVTSTVATAGAAGFGRLISFLVDSMRPIAAGRLYHPGYYVAAFSMAGLACAAALYTRFLNRFEPSALTLGAMTGWFLLTVGCSLTMPGATFIFLWPLLFSLLAEMTRVICRNLSPVTGAIILTAAALPGALIIMPMIHKIFTAFPQGAELVSAPLLTLWMGLLADQLKLAKLPRWISIPKMLIIAIVISLAVALTLSRLNSRQPEFDSVFYALNADTGKAIWASYDSAPSQWSSQFFHESRLATASEYLPENQRTFLQAPAPVHMLPPPTALLMEDKRVNGERRLRLRITSARHAPILTVWVDRDAPISYAGVNGKDLHTTRTDQGSWKMQYCGAPEEGIDLSLTAKTLSAVRIQVQDLSYGWPEQALSSLKPRPADTIPSPRRLNDSTLVIKSFSF